MCLQQLAGAGRIFPGDVSEFRLQPLGAKMVPVMKQPEGLGIGRLNEAPLHASLKEFYAGEDAQMEVPVEGYIVDVKRGDLLIEIQTGNFSAIKTKLQRLVEDHPVLLVYPIALEKWIVKRPKDDGGQETRRKSPKKGKVVEIFKNLVSFPHLLLHDHFTLEIVLTQEEDLSLIHI